jgi:hypothetical protein
MLQDAGVTKKYSKTEFRLSGERYHRIKVKRAENRRGEHVYSKCMIFV